MLYNYFVACDLMQPGQNYDAVIARIELLSTHYAHMQFSLFYVKSSLTMDRLHAGLREVMDANDRLAVIWANDAFVSNYPVGNLRTLTETFVRAA